MLGLHAFVVVATVAAVLLGWWQYDVWQNGRQDASLARVDDAPRPLASVLSADQAFPGAAVGVPVELAGRWLPRSTVYVSDRPLHGRTGFWAVTPVAVCAPADVAGCRRASAVLVVRGWARTVQAAPAAPSGPVRVTGWLQPGEGSGVADAHPGDDVLPQLRVADAIQHVSQDLYGGYVIARTVEPTVQAPGAAPGGTGLAAVTPSSLPKASASTALRNLLYALEWWVFGGFAVYVWWRWCRDELARGAGVASAT